MDVENYSTKQRFAEKNLVENNIDVVTYEIEKPDIVEMLCAATGQDIEQIGLEINELNSKNSTEEE